MENIELIIALFSTFIAFLALFVAIWQNVLNRRSTQVQIVLTLKELANDVNYRYGIKRITSLEHYNNFDAFLKSEAKENQEAIYNAVEYLNFAAHLVEEKLLPRQIIWNRYFWAYRICNLKLLSWWLEGQRRNYQRRFSAFGRMCKRVGEISDEEIEKFDRKIEKRFR